MIWQQEMRTAYGLQITVHQIIVCSYTMSYSIAITLTHLWLNDAIWRHRFGLTLAQVIACCLMAPSHYLNQY